MSFSDERVWSFLNRYYEGKLPKDVVAADFFNVAKCDYCNLLFQEYILNDRNMYLLYEEWISPRKSLDKKRQADISIYKRYASEIENICEYTHKKPCETRVLEYGMGWGFWSNMAKAYNYDTTGLEISKSRVEFAREGGLKIIDDIREVSNESFDYIYSNQVFEHIPNPLATLIELARILKPSGIVHIRVPNGRGIERKLNNPNWRAEKDAIHPLEHINCFNLNALKVLAEQADLSLRRPLFHLDTKAITSWLKHISNSRRATDVLLTKV
jgi:2-polyprenyl-3-methyl-5-hydroxy-6-metoxy-1,4-benzoquinol methylase